MKKITLLAAAAALALMAAPAAASAQWYAGAAYTNFDYDDADIDAVTGRLGYRFNPNFAVEGEASTGVSDDDAELNYNAGLYAMGILPVASNFDLHGRVGYQTTEVDTVLGGVSDDGLGYGVGATWRLTPGFGLRADWTRMEADDGDSDAISLGGAFNL